ncbi:MAG: hypothetical protein M0R38_11030 [Bacteroidia bacterium]|nr:hypothetical protein [Bacteroidia bacterium]
MVETRKITLTKESWQKIDELLTLIPDSEFLRFCLINGIIEEGVKRFDSPRINV